MQLLCKPMQTFAITAYFVICLSPIFVNFVQGNVDTSVMSRNKNRGKGSMWWGIAKAGEPNNISPTHPGMISLDKSVHGTLRRKQRRLSRENVGLLEAVARGVSLAISECQHQFRNQRWNCSIKNFSRGKNLFGKVIEKGCPETAFIYAITSAAVTHSIARACTEGTIETCFCQKHYSSPAEISVGKSKTASAVGRFEWGGCSDNVGFGIQVGREFVDTGERGKSLREKMNLHNNEAGRWHVQSLMRRECKCHGMSGSCTMRTCWMKLSSFRAVSDVLKERYDKPAHIAAHSFASSKPNKPRNNRFPKGSLANNIPTKRENKRKHKYGFQLKPYNSEYKPPGDKDLVYYELSPAFCDKNPEFGIQGTYGRRCNDSSDGVDNCSILCCGRGFTSEEVIVSERCNCRFHWCCDVQCDICKVKKRIDTCV